MHDSVVNVGRISAARHGGNYVPWLLARALSDGGDVVAVRLATLAGALDPCTYGLGHLALVHTACDVLLWRVARRAGTGTPSAVQRA